MESTAEQTPEQAAPEAPRFQVFAANRLGAAYIVRDNQEGKDFPFRSRRTTQKAVPLLQRDGLFPKLLFSSPSKADAYMATGPDILAEVTE